MSGTTVPPGNCVTHGYHGRTYCPRCSTSALPPPPLGQAPPAANCWCGKPAEYDLWGKFYAHQGPNCWKHAREQAGCLCASCVSQSAIRKLVAA